MNVCIVSPGMEHDGCTLNERSLGGSETSAIQLAEALAATPDPFGRKSRVTVFSPCRAPMVANGVQYIPIQGAMDYVAGAEIDVLIVSRALEVLSKPHNAKVCFLWCHDLALGRTAGTFRGVMYQVDRVLNMSRFQAAQYTEVLGLPEGSIEVIRNGIDLSKIPAPRSVPREHGLMVYGARPERGLENLVKVGGIMDKLLAEKSPARLAVCAYDNTVPEMRAAYEALWKRCEELPNVQLVGNLTKEQLYDLYSRAWMYVYPTPGSLSPNFAEISCISAMEAAACGLPFLTNGVGALPETVGKGCGVVIPRASGTDEINATVFTREIQRLLRDELTWNRLSQNAYKHGATLGWGPVAGRLVELADSIMREKSSDPSALYKHFYQLSEIEGCRRIEAEKGGAIDLCEKEQARVASGWKFTESPEAYREHYKLVDAGAKVEQYEGSDSEPRLRVLLDFLRANPGKFKRVLDYGCWIGHQTIRVANQLGESAKVLGVDVTPRNIDLAWECAKTNAQYKNVEFGVYDEMGLSGPESILDGAEFDLILCNEVLEHVLDPAALVEKLERLASPGGTIFVTTPSGPWEAMSYDTFPYRCHVRHIEMADLEEMFAEKENLQVFWKGTGVSDRGRPLGHHYVTWTVGQPAPALPVDWGRKMAYQAPRQTLSVCMIAKNAEGMIGRTLKSVSTIADEIIVADTGSTDSTREIAARYGRVIDAPDPLDPKNEGFEESRNASIAKAKGAWILWVDSDEELLNPRNLDKYLRRNCLNGYGVAQHHLSVDPPQALRPDMPVRLFRSDLGIRFYGIVHEHPELELNRGVGTAIILADTWIAHDGYLTEEVRRKRFLRNIDLVIRDRKKYPERKLGYFLWLRDLIHLIRYRLEQRNGAGPDPQCIAWAREAQKLFEEHYLDKPDDPMVPEALAYYSSANQLLRVGFPVMVRLDVGKTGEREVTGHFRNTEAASSFVSAVMRSIGGQLESKYF